MAMIPTHKACCLALLAAAAVLSACGGMGASTPMATVTAQPSEPASTSSPTPSPSPTLTETPPSTPTVTPTAGPSSTPEPTPVFGSARVGFDFLFGNQPEGCELPCWQGLVVGESDRNDIQNTFEEAFGFSSSRDVFVYNTIPSGEPGMTSIRNIWDIDLDAGEYFDIFVMVDEDTNALHYLGLSWTSSTFGKYLNPQRIIQKLGEPSNIVANIDKTQVENIGILDMLMTYADKGMKFTFRYGVEVTNQPLSDKAKTSRVRFCLKENGTSGSVSMIEPDSPTLSGNSASFQPWQDVFEMSIGETAQRVQKGEAVCLTSTLKDH